MGALLIIFLGVVVCADGKYDQGLTRNTLYVASAFYLGAY